MSIDAPPDFGKRLGIVLAWLEIPQQDMARRLGISSSFLSRIKCGDKKPSKPVAMLMERELGAEAWAFMMGTRKALPQ